MQELVLRAYDIFSSYQEEPYHLFFTESYSKTKFALCPRSNMLITQDIEKHACLAEPSPYRALPPLVNGDNNIVMFFVSQMEHFCANMKYKVVRKHSKIGVVYHSKGTIELDEKYGILHIPNGISADREILTSQISIMPSSVAITLHSAISKNSIVVKSSLTHEYVINDDGEIRYIGTSEAEPDGWLQHVNHFSDFSPNPYNREIYGLIKSSSIHYDGKFILHANGDIFVRNREDDDWTKTTSGWLDYLSETDRSSPSVNEWRIYRTVSKS